ncbi:Thiamin ABC transporter, ATPase component / Thiamine transport ATP-binding protein thiQ [Salmonella enterica subsp. enterica serovar Uganda str. R8-3404]|uniref:Thiamin ABC transporter, ATPase component / Thiamine transport ATP-binding protein thiQ n=1 Tax=Salmonella enterica subsp. enterica serovar Uganda str. R8-3404 TaxID=913083 RepID=A0A6C8H966_SALET|nr:Thiamin ABC transporter, ATPase component / Thiamine transport ATP-binding protein thiQ [Salmonella enterica subsp. enterica serovar Uganda str. R8-3404]
MLKLIDITWLYHHLPMRFTLAVERGEQVAIRSAGSAGAGGQRQRVALARCLVREQPVLLLDEPFSALDPALRQEMLTLVSDICRERQLTLLMVSHSVEDAARIAPRSIVVADGRIAWQGKTDELLSGQASASALLGIKSHIL